jgi:hypothetical protein
VHGHGILQLQTSNQSPETFQLGVLLLMAAAAITFAAKETILAFHVLTNRNSYTIKDSRKNDIKLISLGLA